MRPLWTQGTKFATGTDGSGMALRGVRMVALAALLQQVVAARVADDEFGDERADQLVEPVGLGALLEGDVQRAGEPAQRKSRIVSALVSMMERETHLPAGLWTAQTTPA